MSPGQSHACAHLRSVAGSSTAHCFPADSTFQDCGPNSIRSVLFCARAHVGRLARRERENSHRRRARLNFVRWFRHWHLYMCRLRLFAYCTRQYNFATHCTSSEMPRSNAGKAVAKAASAIANLASPATLGRKRKSAGLPQPSARYTDAPAVLPVPKRGRANSSKAAVTQATVAESKPIGRAKGNRAVEMAPAPASASGSASASAVSSAAAAQCLHNSAYAASHPMRKAELATLAALGPGGLVCGVDEAGRGPLAGPVVAACCHVPLDVHIDGIRDSKDITDEDERERIFEQLTTHPRVRFAVHVNSHTRIDEINILQVRAEISVFPAIAAGALRASHHLPSTNILSCFLIVTGHS